MGLENISLLQKLNSFLKNNEQKHHTGELHKKGTILHQAPQITLFFDSPCIYA